MGLSSLLVPNSCRVGLVFFFFSLDDVCALVGGLSGALSAKR